MAQRAVGFFAGRAESRPGPDAPSTSRHSVTVETARPVSRLVATIETAAVVAVVRTRRDVVPDAALVAACRDGAATRLRSARAEHARDAPRLLLVPRAATRDGHPAHHLVDVLAAAAPGDLAARLTGRLLTHGVLLQRVGGFGCDLDSVRLGLDTVRLGLAYSTTSFLAYSTSGLLACSTAAWVGRPLVGGRVGRAARRGRIETPSTEAATPRLESHTSAESAGTSARSVVSPPDRFAAGRPAARRTR